MTHSAQVTWDHVDDIAELMYCVTVNVDFPTEDLVDGLCEIVNVELYHEELNNETTTADTSVVAHMQDDIFEYAETAAGEMIAVRIEAARNR